jgi:hypothetical protein
MISPSEGKKEKAACRSCQRLVADYEFPIQTDIAELKNQPRTGRKSRPWAALADICAPIGLNWFL